MQEKTLSENVFNYKVFGLNLRSDIPLPELVPGNDEPNVWIRSGRVPDGLPNPVSQSRAAGGRYQAEPDRLLFEIDGIIKFMASEGREILVDPDRSAKDPTTVRLFLLGSALGAVLHQRGLLPLHGSAIDAGGQGVLFIGPSGNGKSTLAAAFNSRGYPVMTDDVCVLSPAHGKTPAILPGYPQLKLWPDTLERFEERAGNLRRLGPDTSKKGLPLEKGFCSRPLAVKRIYVLSPSRDTGIDIIPLKGAACLKVLIENTYRLTFLQGLPRQRDHFRRCAAVAETVTLCRVRRPEGLFLLEELVDCLEADFTGRPGLW